MRIISKQSRKSNQAFTLIEMIGVLAVIAILASMLIPKIFEAINSARINNTVQSYNAVKTAVLKAREASPDRNILAGSVVASDAFFPFRDGLDAGAAAGAVAVIQPGGSMRDDDVIAAAERAGATMLLTGVRHFRH